MMPSVVSSDISVRADFKVRKRDTFNKAIRVKNSDGSPFDITGYSFKMEVRKPGTNSIILSLTSSDGIDISGNIITIRKDASQMDIQAGVFNYDLQATYPDGKVKTWLYGKFVVNHDITA